MQYTILINQEKALEWGLNAQQAMLFAFLYEVPSWARPTTKDGTVFYHISKGKVVAEMPLLTDKPDTVYRLMKQLEERGLLSLTNSGPYTLMAITDQGKTWNRDDDLPRRNIRPNNKAVSNGSPRRNIRRKHSPTSEKNPGYPGEKSDLTPDISPTDHITRSDNQSYQHRQSAGAFPMTLDWKPSDQFSARLLQAGVSPDQLTQEVLGEFVSYRSTTDDQLTEAQWEHKLLQTLLARRKVHADQSGKPSGQQRSGRDAVRDAISDTGDTSWAAGL